MRTTERRFWFNQLSALSPLRAHFHALISRFVTLVSPASILFVWLYFVACVGPLASGCERVATLYDLILSAVH